MAAAPYQLNALGGFLLVKHPIGHVGDSGIVGDHRGGSAQLAVYPLDGL